MIIFHRGTRWNLHITMKNMCPITEKYMKNEYNDITHEIVGTTFNQYCGYNKEPYQNCLAFSFDLG